MQVIEADKIGSATSPLNLSKTVSTITTNDSPKVGDVVVVRALGESVTYGNLELRTGRLAKINAATILWAFSANVAPSKDLSVTCPRR
jgi:hypothetical protein